MQHWNWREFCGEPRFVVLEGRNLSYCFRELALNIPALCIFIVVNVYFIGVSVYVRTLTRRLPTDVKILRFRIVLALLLFFTCLVALAVETYETWTDAHQYVRYLSGGLKILSWLIHVNFVIKLKNNLPYRCRGPLILNAIFLLTCFSTFIGLWTNVHLFLESKSKGHVILIQLVTSGVLTLIKILYLLTLVRNSRLPSVYSEVNGINSEVESNLERHTSTTSRIHLGVAAKNAGIFSYLTFGWVWSLIFKGKEADLNDVDDIYQLPKALRVENVERALDAALNQITSKSTTLAKSSGNEIVTGNILPKSLLRAFGAEYFLYGILKFISTMFQFAGPILLGRLVTFVEDPNGPILHGYLYAFGMFGSAIVVTFADCHYHYGITKIRTKIGGSLAAVVYKKILKVSSCNLSFLSSGEILDMMNTDVGRIIEFCESFHEVWCLPLQIAVALYLVYSQVGLAFLACIGYAVVLVPITQFLCSKILKYETRFMAYKDQRVKLMHEILKGVRLIKFYAWDLHFNKKVQSIRLKELKQLKLSKYLDAMCVYFWQTTPVIMAVATFTFYIFLGHQLTAAKVFTILALFGLLLAPLNAFPWVLTGVVESWVSVKRIQKLLRLPNTNHDDYYSSYGVSDKTDVTFNNGTFLWKNPHITVPDDENCLENEDSCSGDYDQKNVGRSVNEVTSSIVDNVNSKDVSRQNFSLEKISLTAHQGDLIGIIGKIGSGKTSLINALLSEMYKLDGEIIISEEKRRSGFGIFTQESWIQHGTIRDNILFGKDYDKEMYNAVVKSCALVEDLKMWNSGDLTQVGENGVTLSGGQKARLTLARAIYQDKDIYLLDDPFSAVDADVAKHIYDKCIRGMLKRKTVFLSTHHHHYLRKANHIVVMEDGKIKEQGPPDVILKSSISRLISSEDVSHNKKEDDVDDEGNEDDLMKKEDKEYGAIKVKVYKTYWKSIGSRLGILICLSLLLMQVSQNAMDLWLATWVSATNDNQNDGNVSSNFTKHGTSFYLTIYGSIGVANSLFTLMRAFLFAYGGIQSAIWIHNKLLSSIMKANVGFFESTPLGRILNRFSSDIEIIDDVLPFVLNIVLSDLVSLFGSLFVIVYSIYWIILIIIPLAVVYYVVQKLYRKTSREISRIKSITLSPMYTHFSESLSGHVVIRAFSESERFSNIIIEKLTDYHRACYTGSLASIWLSFYLEMIGVLLVGGISILVIIKHHFSDVSSGFVGLAISSSLTVNSILEELVTHFASFERNMVSVERVSEYIEQTVSESDEGNINPPALWPECGVIKFRNVYLRYRENLPFVLKDINFETKPAEKIGIVGRTGSGKSSLLSLLFRIVNRHSGDVYVDDINIDDLKLSDLRSKITIIPQDPFLFSGTIRENIDPRGKHTDSEIWDALQLCQLGDMVRDRIKGLDGNVGEQGKELSSGQKQLLCLARAIITDAKVLCIDEATASVDLETDRLIQETIRKVFKNNTVLTIAHRIDTIMHCDRILVMSEGRIVEFDTPGNLLQNDESHFYNLYHK